MWIDYFRGSVTTQTEKLDWLLGTEFLAIGDLILTEVLQGFSNQDGFNEVHRLLSSLTLIDLGGHENAIQAARNFIALRKLGITVRRTIDAIIATRCITSNLDLLHNDRDFDAFSQHLGLSVV